MKIIKVFHCDGLLLCVLKDTFKLMVWNPYLGQIRWIEPPSYSFRGVDGMDRYTYALGYDHEKKSHKILRFMDVYRYSHHPRLRPIRHLGCYEIYDLESSIWRTLDVGTPHWFIYFYDAGASLNGNTYWLAKHRSSYYDGSDGLICFDFTSETFGPVLPLPFPSHEYPDADARLSSLKGWKLSLLLRLNLDIEIWVTDPNNVSWSKLFKVDTAPASKFYFPYSGFFIDEEKKVAVFFDTSINTRHTLNFIGEAGFFSQVDVDPLIERVSSNYLDPAHVCSYVPSLVQVQTKKPVFKRKQQSRRLIRPCQQDKSRLEEEEENMLNDY